jgi:hypothetical protein
MKKCRQPLNSFRKELQEKPSTGPMHRQKKTLQREMIILAENAKKEGVITLKSGTAI